MTFGSVRFAGWSTSSKHVEQILSVINITSDIKLVSNSSTITMMHGPINIRFINQSFQLLHSTADKADHLLWTWIHFSQFRKIVQLEVQNYITNLSSVIPLSSVDKNNSHKLPLSWLHFTKYLTEIILFNLHLFPIAICSFPKMSQHYLFLL